MDVKIQLCLCTLASFVAVGLAISCYECSSSDSACLDPAANNVAKVDCAGSCISLLTQGLGVGTHGFNYERGCSSTCINQVYSWFGIEYIYACCGTDNCNGQDRPNGWTKCHECNSDTDFGCVDWDYVDLGQYTFCNGVCSKSQGNIDFFGVNIDFVNRGCEQGCLEFDNFDYSGLGTYSQYCCAGDLCNGGTAPSAAVGLLLAAGALAMWL